MALTVGIKGSDKFEQTAAAAALIAALTARGYKVGAIKSHTHGGFEVDKPGKASYRHREAGAAETVMSSPDVLVDIRYRNTAPTLAEAAARFAPEIDVIVCDGFADQADLMMRGPLEDAAAAADIVDRAMVARQG